MGEYQTERQKIKLKPCPFCGGEARLKKHYRLEQTWYVQCSKCGIKTKNSVQAPYESWKTTMNYPIRLWNRRVDYGDKTKKVRGNRATELLEHISALFTKDEVIAMFTEIKMEIEKSYYDTTIIGDYEDEVRIDLVELDDVNEVIQQKIDKLKEGTDGR